MGLRSVSVAPRLEDGAKKDQVLSNSFSLLRHHRSEATGHADVATENDRTEATLALAQRVKLQETSAAAAGRRVKELRQNLTQQEEMFQAQQAQLTEKQRQIAELQRAVSSLQAQAKEEVAADHGLELKYQQQAEEYQKDVEHLETALRGAKEQLSGLRQTQLRDQEELTEGKHRLQKDESHVQLQQQKRQEEEYHEDAMQRQVLQLKDDIDTSLVQAGAASVASRSSHEQRLTEVVRVAARKQQEIQELQANVSGLEAQVQQETMQLDQLRSKEHFDTEKVKEEIQEVRQKKLYRLRAAQDMYHKLPEVFRQRAKVDEERRKNEAFEASQSRTQQQLLREEKLKESEKQEEEELHTELRSSKQRLQSINPRANGKKSVAKKRVQQLRAKLADTKRDEAKEQKKFMERSTALQQEIRQEEGRGRRKSSEKARAVEKMQGELLALEDKIDSLGRQQNQLAAEAAQLQSSFSLKQMQDQQEVHHAKTEAERKRLQLTEVEKEHRRTAQEASLQWKTQLQQEQLTQATHLASLKHRMEEKVEELRHRDAIELEGLQALAGTVKAKHSSAAKLTRFLEREPRLASAVKHTLKMDAEA
eukprot:s126_g22.t1